MHRGLLTFRSSAAALLLTWLVGGAACARQVTPTPAARAAAPEAPAAPDTAASAAPDAASAAADATAASAAPDAAASAAATARAPAPPAKCTDSLPPADRVRDNITDTALSGLAEIVASSKVGLDGKTPAPTTGYVNFRFEVRVLEWFSGSGPERMVLHQGAEAGSPLPGPGGLVLFSACALPDGSASEPDVGYFIRLDPACRGEAKALGDAAAKQARAGGKKKPRACIRR